MIIWKSLGPGRLAGVGAGHMAVLIEPAARGVRADACVWPARADAQTFRLGFYPDEAAAMAHAPVDLARVLAAELTALLGPSGQEA